MSARYELRRVGVYDRVLKRTIKPHDPEWVEYRAAAKRGEVPAARPAALGGSPAERSAKTTALRGHAAGFTRNLSELLKKKG